MAIILAHKFVCFLNSVNMRICVLLYYTTHSFEPTRTIFGPNAALCLWRVKMFPVRRVLPSMIMLHMWKRLVLHIWKTPNARQKKVKLLQIFQLLMQNSSCPTQIASKLRWEMSREKKEHLHFQNSFKVLFEMLPSVSEIWTLQIYVHKEFCNILNVILDS